MRYTIRGSAPATPAYIENDDIEPRALPEGRALSPATGEGMVQSNIVFRMA